MFFFSFACRFSPIFIGLCCTAQKKRVEWLVRGSQYFSRSVKWFRIGACNYNCHRYRDGSCALLECVSIIVAQQLSVAINSIALVVRVSPIRTLNTVTEEKFTLRLFCLVCVCEKCAFVCDIGLFGIGRWRANWHPSARTSQQDQMLSVCWLFPNLISREPERMHA